MGSKQSPPEDFAPAEKTLWNQSEEFRQKAIELGEQAKRLRKKGKEAAAPFILQAEALEMQATDLDRKSNESDVAMRTLTNARERGYIEYQMRIIKRDKLGNCPTCEARGERDDLGRRGRPTPCVQPGTMIVLSTPHPDRKHKEV